MSHRDSARGLAIAAMTLGLLLTSTRAAGPQGPVPGCEMRLTVVQPVVTVGCPPVSQCRVPATCDEMSMEWGGQEVFVCHCGGGRYTSGCCELGIRYPLPGGRPYPIGVGGCVLTECPGDCDIEWVPNDPDDWYSPGEWVAGCAVH